MTSENDKLLSCFSQRPSVLAKAGIATATVSDADAFEPTTSGQKFPGMESLEIKCVDYRMNAAAPRYGVAAKIAFGSAD